MVAVSSEGLPLDDRSNNLKIPIITLIVFSSIFVGLRLWISWKNRNFFQLTDHFLWSGHVRSSVTECVIGTLTSISAISSSWGCLCLQDS